MDGGGRAKQFKLGIDIGGTFTDIVMLDESMCQKKKTRELTRTVTRNKGLIGRDPRDQLNLKGSKLLRIRWSD